MSQYRFSPSTLKLLHDCPRCFWLTHNARIPRPRGIFPGLPGAIDKIIQAETAQHAGKSKPKWLLPGQEGVINPGPKKLVAKTDDFTLTGIVDDLVLQDNKYIIIDYKTARKPYTTEMALLYYSLQMDCYSYLCEGNGYKPVEKVYLVFFTPEPSSSNNHFNFEITHLELPANPDSARKALAKAVETCQLEEAPAASMECEYCRWRERIEEKRLLEGQ